MKSAHGRTTRLKLMHVVTVPVTLGFFTGQLTHIQQCGYDVSVVASPEAEFERMLDDLSIRGHGVPMEREISLGRDLVSLLRLWKLFRRERPHIVQGHTPKAGLLSMVAAWLARVPVRIYHMHGLRFETTLGLKRKVLKLMEKLSCSLSHRVISVSRSVADEAVSEGVCPRSKITVLANGSANGVDARRRFNPETAEPRLYCRLRLEHGIPGEAIVLGFVGRLVRDKGIRELVDAWRIISAKRPDTHLFVVGEFESGDPVPDDVRTMLQTGERIHLLGRVGNMPEVYRSIDVLLLPTYREGLPNVPLEAAAMGIPVVATRVTGCVDAVLHDRTGVLVPARDANAVAEAALRYIEDPDLRVKHGRAGREWVLEQFQPERVWEALRDEYDVLVAERLGKLS